VRVPPIDVHKLRRNRMPQSSKDRQIIPGGLVPAMDTETESSRTSCSKEHRERQRQRQGGGITAKPVKRNIPGDVAAGEQVIIQLLQALLGIEISELYSHCRQFSRAQRELLQTNELSEKCTRDEEQPPTRWKWQRWRPTSTALAFCPDFRSRVFLRARAVKNPHAHPEIFLDHRQPCASSFFLFFLPP